LKFKIQWTISKFSQNFFFMVTLEFLKGPDQFGYGFYPMENLITILPSSGFLLSFLIKLNFFYK